MSDLIFFIKTQLLKNFKKKLKKDKNFKKTYKKIRIVTSLIIFLFFMCLSLCLALARPREMPEASRTGALEPPGPRVRELLRLARDADVINDKLLIRALFFQVEADQTNFPFLQFPFEF